MILTTRPLAVSHTPHFHMLILDAHLTMGDLVICEFVSRPGQARSPGGGGSNHIPAQMEY